MSKDNFIIPVTAPNCYSMQNLTGSMWCGQHHKLGNSYDITDDEYDDSVDIIAIGNKNDEYYEALATVIMYETFMSPHECQTYMIIDFDGIGGIPANEKLGRMYEWCNDNNITVKLVSPGAFLFSSKEDHDKFLDHWFK